MRPASWLGLSGASVLWVVHDLRRRNAQLGSVMKLVWVLTTAYAGPLGAAVYRYAGRRQIRRDTLWRRAFRSTAHCYSGCGLGELIGVILTMGVLAAGQAVVAAVTFALAYAAGLVLTVAPLVHDGEPLRQSIRDGVLSETAGEDQKVQVGADGHGLHDDDARCLELSLVAFAAHDVSWFEEPVTSDDLDGLRLARDRAPAGMAIAAGEYGFDLPYFVRMLDAGAVDVLQADASAARA